MPSRKTVITGIADAIAGLLLLFGGVAGKIVPPERGGASTDQLLTWAVCFGCLVFFLLVAVIVRLVTARMNWKGWVIWAIAALVFGALAVAFSLSYFKNFSTLIVRYEKAGSATFIRGNVLTKAAQIVRDRDPDRATDQYLLQRFSGEPTKVWTSDSIEQNRQLLLNGYLMSFLFVYLTILAAIEALFGELLPAQAPAPPSE